MKELVAPGQLFQTTISPTFIVKYGEVISIVTRMANVKYHQNYLKNV